MKKQKKEVPDIFERFEKFCKEYSTTILIFILSLFTVMSFLLFNLRVSIGGDDSTYVIRAVNLLKEGAYPSFQGPVYPLFLSLIISLFGIKLGLLKISSFLLMLGAMWGFYKIFKTRIEYSLLFITLFLLSISSYFIFFASQTYSEALFLALQIPVFFFLFKDIDNEFPFRWKRLLLIAVFIIIGYQTRTVGLGMLIAVLLFYVLNKKYKQAATVLVFSLLTLALFLTVKNAFWHNGFFDDGQVSTLIYQHPYDKTQGLETLGGYLTRFIDNSNLYLSKQFLKMTGLKAGDSLTYNPILTILLYAIFIFGAFRAFKNNKYLLFTAVYIAVMLGITFLVLQKIWDQYRLIIPYFPFILLMILYAFRQLKSIAKSKLVNLAILGLILVSSFSLLSDSFEKVDLVTLRKNINGNRLAGFTDDWVNYLSMAEYVDEQLPDDAYVAVRKPNMARLYANGRKFYGIYRFDTENPDELLQQLKDKNVTHIIMASLRKNPAVYDQQTINTIQRYMYNIVKKYPRVFELVHQTGGQEPAYLFKVHYDRLITNEELKHLQQAGK